MILLPLMLLWAPRPMQFTPSARWALLLFFATALAIGVPSGLGLDCLATEATEATESEPPVRSRTAADGGELSREGTRVVGLVGTFREIGRRWTFIADDKQTAYRVLENQSLERLCRAIKEDPYDVRWKVSGELTEFMDENFLLLNQTQRAPD